MSSWGLRIGRFSADPLVLLVLGILHSISVASRLVALKSLDGASLELQVTGLVLSISTLHPLKFQFPSSLLVPFDERLPLILKAKASFSSQHV